MLARRLAEGQDREQTAVLFDRVENVVQRAVVNQRSAQVLENAQDDIDKARDILNQLRVYYERPTVPPVAAEPTEEKAEEKPAE
jgi:flagellin-specific chaperone FliS